MKTKFSTRILAFVLIIALVVPTLVFNVSAEDTATLSFANTAQRTSFSTTKQVWEQNGVTFTNDKASASSNVANYANPVRLYQNSSITVAYNGGKISKIVFDANSSSYATALKNSIGTTATTSVSSDKVTVTFATPVSEFTIAKLTAQVRMDSITVTYVADSTDEEPVPSLKLEGDNYVQIGDDLTLKAKLENIEGDVVWTSSNTDVAEVDEDGIVTGNTMGKTTITAQLGDLLDSLEVYVYPVANTTLTVAEAIDLAKFTGTFTTPYAYKVVGVITEITEAYTEQYKNISFNISDDTGEILVYRLKAEGVENLTIGQKVTVGGPLVHFNSSTPEFSFPTTYELIIEDTTEEILKALDELELKMSIAYRYDASLEQVEVAGSVEDLLNKAFTEFPGGTSYVDFSDKVGASGAVYAGNSAGGNNSIQLRSDKSSAGIVTTTSGGKIKSVTVTWNSNTANGRTLDIYGKNTAYTAASDLYSASTQGTLLGSVVYGTSTKLEVEGDYSFIGIRSKSGAQYVESIVIEWETGSADGATEEKVVYSDSKFVFKFAVDSKIIETVGDYKYGIMVTTGAKTEFFETVLSEEEGLCYVTVNLGDIINNLERLNTEFTIKAYVEVDGGKYTANTSKTYSVASIIDCYYNDEGIESVKHLYEYLVDNNLIVENA